MVQRQGLGRGGLPRRALPASPARPQGRPRPPRRSRGRTSSRDPPRLPRRPAPTSSTTNTFTATSIAQADYGLEAAVYEMNVAAARWLAAPPTRGSADADEPRFVAGSIGPLNVTLSLSPKVDDPAFRAVTFDEVREAYAEQIARPARRRRRPAPDRDDLRHPQRQGGDRRREEVFERRSCRSVMLSVTITDRSGRTLSGQTVEAFWISVAHAEPLGVGVNCALGAREMRPVRRRAGAHRATVRQLLPERRAARTPSAATTSGRGRRAACSASSPRGAA